MENKYRRADHRKQEKERAVNPAKIVNLAKSLGEIFGGNSSGNWLVHRIDSVTDAVTTIKRSHNSVETIKLNFRDPSIADERAASITLQSATNIDGNNINTTSYSLLVIDNNTIQCEKRVSRYNEMKNKYEIHELKDNIVFDDLNKTLGNLPGLEELTAKKVRNPS